VEARSVWIIVAAFLGNCLFVWGVSAYNNRLKRLAPPNENVDVRSPDAERRFARLNNLFVLYYLVLTVVFVVLMYAVSTQIATWCLSSLPTAELSIPATGSSLSSLVALFSGMGLTAIASGPIMRLVWPVNGTFFSTYLSVRRYGCDHDRLCRGLSFPLLLIAAAVLAFGTNSYVQARSTVIAERSFLDVRESTYEYSNIKSIETGVGRLGRGFGRDYFITFRDGTGFDFYRRLPSGGELERRRLAEIISRKTGIPIVEVKNF
jgi:hypothetical protein